MKMADIVVGGEYSVRGLRASVLEKPVANGTRMSGVRILYTEGYYKGKETVVASSTVDCTWADHCEQDAVRRRRAEAHRALVEQLTAAKDQVLSKLGAHGVQAEGALTSVGHWMDGPMTVELTLTDTMFEKLSQLLDRLPAAELERADGDDSLSAMFA